MVGVAVIGTGVISEKHLEACLDLKKYCKLLALCDIYPEKARMEKEKYRLEDVKVYDDYRKMLKREDIQLVLICTPPFTHGESAIASLQAGKNVLVEKPMAPSLEECDRMLKAQKESGRYLGVISQNRYVQDNRNLKQMLDRRAAGRILFGQAESCWFRGHSYFDLWWRGTWEKEGGGCTLNHGVHQIDLLNWIMGEPRTVTAVLGNLAHDNAEFEDISFAVLTYADGAMATIMTSLITHGEGQRLMFQCEKASLASPWEVRSNASTTEGFPIRDGEQEQKLQAIWESCPRLEYTNHKGQIENVLRSLEQGETPSEDGRDGRMTIEVITAIYQSAFTGQTVTLPLGVDSPFYTREGFMKNVKYFK